MDDEPLTNEPPDELVRAPVQPVVTSEKLFQGRREILIDHEGERYRLRTTRRNRLILQK